MAARLNEEEEVGEGGGRRAGQRSALRWDGERGARRQAAGVMPAIGPLDEVRDGESGPPMTVPALCVCCVDITPPSPPLTAVALSLRLLSLSLSFSPLRSLAFVRGLDKGDIK